MDIELTFSHNDLRKYIVCLLYHPRRRISSIFHIFSADMPANSFIRRRIKQRQTKNLLKHALSLP